MEKLKILFLVTFVSFVKAEIGICSTTNDFNTFNISNYIRFRSPNYPESMVNGSTELICNSIFLAANKNDYLWFAFINGAIMEFIINDNVTIAGPVLDFESNYDVQTYVSTTGIMIFQFMNQLMQNQPWTAFDAIVLSFSPSSVSDCPFSGQSITMNSETMIPISSDFGIYTNASKNCSWTFKNNDPNSYQFKIYIKILTFDYKIVIKNDNIINGIGLNVSLYDPQVLYLKGSELDIMLYNIYHIFDHNGFFGIISIVPIIENYFEGCQYTSNDNGSMTISNLDYINGYNAFTTCALNISIKNGYEAILDVSQYWIEAGVDKLTVSKYNQIFEIKNAGLFSLKSDLNGSMFKFVADGNILQAGFMASIVPIKCECANSTFVIPCNETSTLTPLPNGVSTYCDYQDCNYTVLLDSSCSMDYFTIQPTADLRNTSWLAIYINGNIFQNFTEYATPYILPFPRRTNLTIIFHSGKSVSPFVIGNPRWLIGVTAILSPMTSKIMLNTSNPTYTIWLDNMNANEAITICSPENDLELFVVNGFSLNVFNLYDSDGLTNFVSTLENLPNITPGNSINVIKSNSGCFTIYLSERAGYFVSTAFFRMQKTHTKNCNTQQNIVRLIQNVPATFSINATSGGTCEMIVFSGQYDLNPLLSLSDFQTSSSDATFSFSSGLNGRLYFNMPSSERDLWKQTALYTPALRVVVPASASLTFNISDGSSYINEENAKRKGILVSPLYSGTNATIFLPETLYSFNLNTTRSANFVVKDISPCAIVTLKNIVTNEYHNFTENENYCTNGSGFYISTIQNGNNAFRIEYGFDVLVNDTTATTTTALTTTATALLPSKSSTLKDTSGITSTESTSTVTLTKESTPIILSSTTQNNGHIFSCNFVILLISVAFAFYFKK